MFLERDLRLAGLARAIAYPDAGILEQLTASLTSEDTPFGQYRCLRAIGDTISGSGGAMLLAGDRRVSSHTVPGQGIETGAVEKAEPYAHPGTYKDRRKLSRCCLSAVLKWSYCLITALASDCGPSCSLIAPTRSLVRPSCRK
jgi:hypothetical protein